MSLSIIRPVGLMPLMVVSFEIDAEFAAAFNDFYNSKFLPELLQLNPQLRSIRRFEGLTHMAVEAGSGSFLTLYELDSEATLQRTGAIFAHPDFEETLGQFRHYKERALRDFARINYKPIFNAERPPAGAGLAPIAQNFAWIVRLDISRGREETFLPWYLEHYQPAVFGNAPSLTAAHSYQENDPNSCNIISIYEAASLDDLAQSLENLNETHRGLEVNKSWRDFCLDATITRMESRPLRSVFALP